MENSTRRIWESVATKAGPVQTCLARKDARDVPRIVLAHERSMLWVTTVRIRTRRSTRTLGARNARPSAFLAARRLWNPSLTRRWRAARIDKVQRRLQRGRVPVALEGAMDVCGQLDLAYTGARFKARLAWIST